jgi:hypothetical protein
MRERLYALLISLFAMPFLVGGILLGFYTGAQLQRAGMFGLNQNNWAAIFVDLGLAAIGIYLGGLVAYVALLLGATTFFSRSQIELFASRLPQDTGGNGSILRMPFTVISNFFWSRAR